MNRSKTPSPWKTRSQSWKVLQEKYYEEHTDVSKKKGNPIGKHFLNWLAMEFIANEKYEKEFYEVFEYMLYSTLNNYKTAQTNQYQKERMVATAYEHLLKYGLKRYNPSKGTFFNFVLTIIQNSFSKVIIQDTKERENDQLVVEELTLRHRGHFTRDMLKNMPISPSLFTNASSNIEETLLLEQVYEDLKLFELDIKTTLSIEPNFANLDVDFIIIKDHPITKNTDDSRFRQKKVIAQFAVYTMQREKMIFENYQKLDSFPKGEINKMLKEGKLKPFAVFEQYNRDIINEQNGQSASTLYDKSVHIRSNGFAYYAQINGFKKLLNEVSIKDFIKKLSIESAMNSETYDDSIVDLMNSTIRFKLKSQTEASLKEWFEENVEEIVRDYIVWNDRNAYITNDIMQYKKSLDSGKCYTRTHLFGKLKMKGNNK